MMTLPGRGFRLRTRLKELSPERRRFGYRRLHILLEREGWKVNWKKVCRVTISRFVVSRTTQPLQYRIPVPRLPNDPKIRWLRCSACI